MANHERGQVGRRQADDHAVEVVLDAGEERGGVPTQRQAVQTDRGRALEAGPRDRAADVPHGLRERLEVDDAVGTRERDPGLAPAPARPVLGQHGMDDVDAELAVQCLRAHPAHVDRAAHPGGVDADEPRARPVVVAQDVGVPDPVVVVGEPGGVGVGDRPPVVARIRHVLVAEAERAAHPHRGLPGGRGRRPGVERRRAVDEAAGAQGGRRPLQGRGVEAPLDRPRHDVLHRRHEIVEHDRRDRRERGAEPRDTGARRAPGAEEERDRPGDDERELGEAGRRRGRRRDRCLPYR